MTLKFLSRVWQSNSQLFEAVIPFSTFQATARMPPEVNRWTWPLAVSLVLPRTRGKLTFSARLTATVSLRPLHFSSFQHRCAAYCSCTIRAPASYGRAAICDAADRSVSHIAQGPKGLLMTISGRFRSGGFQIEIGESGLGSLSLSAPHDMVDHRTRRETVDHG